ncbi:putative inactive tyrosine-protein kinase Wsck isoform X1 [Dendroctonus ponderosae]|uniref:Protein kinase domain-containing protein n=1 Tax=Dendroctonus ponderosae TaxID=77166 RepID=A0AAR5NXR3_DENPD|nr:putative inactive tyrosine-protein kinase Wsck isoform X1 [Dendroctonus ponderosae]
MNKLLYLLISCFAAIHGFYTEPLGCFKNIPPLRRLPLTTVETYTSCQSFCSEAFYRYFYFYNGSCGCHTFLGEQIAAVSCDKYCSKNKCESKIDFTNVYNTGNLVPGPPNNLLVTRITTNSCRVEWTAPDSYVSIWTYSVKAIVLKTFSSYPAFSQQWTFGNSTFRAEIPDLLSATRYNITVSASSSDGEGSRAYQLIITKLAEPEYLPPEPEVLGKYGNTILVRMRPVMNNNGPISAYRIVVVKSNDNQAFQKDNVLSYSESREQGLSYYIAAEISPKITGLVFDVGDGKNYGSFYNAPLDPEEKYDILSGIVSNFNCETKIAYSQASGYYKGISILNVPYQDTSGFETIIIVLWVAIGILGIPLLLILGAMAIIKIKIYNSRQRLTDNQELTLQGPMIEVENNGYIHEEEHIPAISHYRNLKQKVRIIPSNQLKIEPTNLLGVGRFGKVNPGTLHENDGMTTVTCYSIYDKKMNQDIRKSKMLQELDILIKTGKHENIINLIGTSETRDLVVVVMEHSSLNLKALLLKSRDKLPGKFSTMTETQALEIVLGICKGMAHLHSLNIIHKHLCARSILITNDNLPKICNFGIAEYFSHNKIPDYTRWTALEVLKGNAQHSKSDVWSFACVVWEIMALGGTPYGNIPDDNDISENLVKGVRLSQLSYVSDDLYQIMLDCWQLIPDERPKFMDLVASLENLKDSHYIPPISFNVFSNFHYEQFYPNMELSVRPPF